jgi:transposase-like protein
MNAILMNYEIDSDVIEQDRSGVDIKLFKKKCSFSQSINKGTWCEQANISYQQIAEIMVIFCNLDRGAHIQQFMVDEIGISSATAVDWQSFCREICIDFIDKHSSKLAGPGKIVEIDEAKIGKRKYNRGRYIEGQWVFGGIERDTRNFFIVPVPDRTANTLLEIIKEWIHPGTTIISDCWSSYNRLGMQGFQHLTVNHSLNFVDPVTRTHTQNIECLWRSMREVIPKYGRSDKHMLGYLAEFYWKTFFPNKGARLHYLLLQAAELYKPDTHHPNQSLPGTSQGTTQ